MKYCTKIIDAEAELLIIDAINKKMGWSQSSSVGSGKNFIWFWPNGEIDSYSNKKLSLAYDRGGHHQKDVSYEEMFRLIAKHTQSKEIKIELNEQYTAVVSANKVMVGCQTISFDKVEEIYKAVQEVKSS